MTTKVKTNVFELDIKRFGKYLHTEGVRDYKLYCCQHTFTITVLFIHSSDAVAFTLRNLAGRFEARYDFEPDLDFERVIKQEFGLGAESDNY